MKKILTLVVVAGGLNLCQAQNFTADLTSSQEAPINNTDTADDGTYSTANFTLSGDTLTVTSAFYYNLVGSPTEIAVYDAPPGFGESGPLFDLTLAGGDGPGFGTYSGSGTLTSGEVSDLNTGNLNVNIITTASAQGEIRGAITAVPEPATMTLMGIGSLAWLAKRRKKA